MLLSLRELVVWTGLGPFETSLHALSLALLTILITLKVESIISASWHTIFLPLYTALALSVYYEVVLYVRMFFTAWKHSKRLLICIFLLNLLGVGVLLSLEVVVAEYLDRRVGAAGVITVVCLLFGYLLLRMPLVFRTLRHDF